MTPEERAVKAIGWLVATHPWASGALKDVIEQIRAAQAEERERCATFIEVRGVWAKHSAGPYEGIPGVSWLAAQLRAMEPA